MCVPVAKMLKGANSRNYVCACSEDAERS